MSDQKTPEIDVEKQPLDKTQGENNEPLEKVKEKPPPGINASLVIFYAICFFMFTIGWVNLNSCTVSRLIPIYLIVAGFVGALAKLMSRASQNKYLFNITIILVIFYIIWHCLGTYWVYREYQPNYDYTREEKYCDRTTFLLSFWILNLQYTVFGFTILLTACSMLMRGDFKKK